MPTLPSRRTLPRAATATLRNEVERYAEIRSAVKKHSGEELDIKPFEADMRHLINTYVQADPASDLGTRGKLSLVELIVETGINDAIARKLNAGGKLSRNAIAEAIINNVRKTIIRDPLTDQKFYAEMSKLLDEFIKQSRAETKAYEAFLKKAEALAKQLAGARGVDGIPPTLHGNLRRPRPSSTSPRINPVIDEQGSSVGRPLHCGDAQGRQARAPFRPPAGGAGHFGSSDGNASGSRSRLRDIQTQSDTRSTVQTAQSSPRDTETVCRVGESSPIGATPVVERRRARHQALCFPRPPADRPSRAAEERFAKACCNCPPMAQVTAPRCCPPLIRKWEAKLKVKVTAYFLPRMKTKWGSCNASAGHVRLNTELVTKPKDSREYVVVHDMTHSSSPLTISALSGFSNSTT